MTLTGGLVKLATLTAMAMSVSGCLHGMAAMNMLGALMMMPMPKGEYAASSDAEPVQYVTTSAPATSTTYVTKTVYVTNYSSSSGSSRGSSYSRSHRHRR